MFLTGLSSIRQLRVKVMDEAMQPAQIASGQWQLVAGCLLAVLGAFGALASTPLNGAGGFADLCFSLAGAAFFWGVLLRCLSILERKIDVVLNGYISSAEEASDTVAREPIVSLPINGEEADRHVKLILFAIAGVVIIVVLLTYFGR